MLKRRNPWILAIAVMVMSAMLAIGCSSSKPTTSNTPSSGTNTAPASGQPAKEKLKIAFIPQLIGIPYFTAMEQGGKEAAEKLGVEFLYVGATQASAPEQVRLMDNLIRQKVNAISVSVLDSASINPIIKKAKEAGIAVYTSDSDSPSSDRQVYVAQALDEDLGATLIDRLALQMNNEGKVGIVSGESTATNLNAWIDAMKRRATEKYPKVQIVDIRYTAGGSSEDALRQATELMTSIRISRVWSPSLPPPFRAWPRRFSRPARLARWPSLATARPTPSASTLSPAS
jgi:rhamnose transport system substrate-binding protein